MVVPHTDMLRLVWPLLLVLFGSLLYAAPAEACGGAFAYRPPKSSETTPLLMSDGSEVALMRRGTMNVVSLSMSYRGPVDDFAVIVPVPVVLQEDDVTALSPGVFERLRKITGPRLVEQWEQDPCFEDFEAEADSKEGGTGTRAAGPEGSLGEPGGPAVVVEAAFDVDEYEVVILGASDSAALEKWLADNGYALPKGIEPFLRPYIAEGYKFFVAKVDVAKVEVAWGRAKLSPIRFHFRHERFALPIRLGLANVDGPQDLIVYLLGKSRFEVASYDNVFAPTNVALAPGLAESFDVVYERFLAEAFAEKPRSVITEFAWDADACAGCDGAGYDNMLDELGAEGLELEAKDLVITRLHARYDQSFDKDFVFRAADPVAGGDEEVATVGPLPDAQTRKAEANRFRGTYFIRYPYTDPTSCYTNHTGSWTGEGQRPPPKSLAPDAPLAELTATDHSLSSGDRVWRAVHGQLGRTRAWRLLIPVLLGLVLLVFSIRRHQREGHGQLFPIIATLLLSASPILLLVHHEPEEAAMASTLPEVQYLAFVIAVSLLVGRVTRRRGSVGVAAAIALAPFLVGLATMIYGIARAALPAFRADLHPLIVSYSEVEAGGGMVVGAVLSSLLLVLVVRLCVARSAEDGTSQPLGLPLWLAVVVVGAAGVALAYAPVFVVDDHWPWVAVVWTLPAIWLGTRRLAVTPQSPRERHQRALTLVGVAVLMMSLAVLAHTREIVFDGLDALGARSVDPSQRATILSSTLADSATFLRFAPLAVLGAAVGPIIVAWRSGRGRLSLGMAELRGAAPALVAVVVAGAMFAVTNKQIADGMAGTKRAAVSLVSDELTPFSSNISRGWRFDGSLTGAGFAVTRDHRLLGVAANGGAPEPFTDALYAKMSESMASDDRDALLLVDEAMTVGRLRSALDPVMARGHRTFRLQIGRDPASVDGLGIYAPVVQVRDVRRAIPFTWRHELDIDYPDPERETGMSGAVAVRLVGDDSFEAVSLLGREGALRYRYSELRVTGPRPKPGERFEVHGSDDGAFDALLWRAKTKTFVVCMREDDTLGEVIELILALQDPKPSSPEHAPQYRTWEALHPQTRIVVTPDHAPFAQELGT